MQSSSLNTDVRDKVYFITGASRGIGRAIAIYLAAKGAKVVIAAKTVESNDKLPGTIFSVVEEIEKAGGLALAIPLDVRDEQQVKDAIAKTIEHFGPLDGLINNAGVLRMTDVESTPIKDFNLMNAINYQAIVMLTKYAFPHLKLSENGHVLNISPPIDLDPGWFLFAYTQSKYAMSMCTMAFAEQFKLHGIAVNSLWPETTVDTSAVRNLLGGDTTVAMSRKPDIVAKAAHHILTSSANEVTGKFFIDSQVLIANGEADLSTYRVDPTQPLLLDFFIGKPPKSMEEALKRVAQVDESGLIDPSKVIESA